MKPSQNPKSKIQNPKPSLLFYCAAEADLATIRRDGVRDAGGGLRLWTSLEAASGACEALILIVAAAALPDLVFDDGAGPVTVYAGQIPPPVIVNLDPYLPPVPVIAGGGYVARPGDGEPEVLLILRRGVWDLPKGKRDPGETVEACALREVREEIGVEALRLGPSLGTTIHGYERDGAYHVKTTHWFLMRTPETHFTPEAREGIEAVAWTPWREARRRIGYASFRDHMQRVEAAVREALRDVG